MTNALRQLTLDLFADRPPTFQDYHCGPNVEVVAGLSRWARGEGPWYVLLWGGVGVGKTHLVQAAVKMAHDQGASAMYVPLPTIRRYGPRALEDLHSVDHVALDDLQTVAGDDGWDQAVFNLFNQIQAQGGRLLLSSAAAPRGLSFSTDDLGSRIASGLTYHLDALTDDEKRLALQMKGVRRGLKIPDDTAHYLLRRCNRDMHSLTATLNLLDTAALSRQRSLTIKFVREILGT
jgi:DnaA family protein